MKCELCSKMTNRLLTKAFDIKKGIDYVAKKEGICITCIKNLKIPSLKDYNDEYKLRDKYSKVRE